MDMAQFAFPSVFDKFEMFPVFGYLWVKLVWMSVTSLGLMYGYFHGEGNNSE